jgi:hypothetical protein
LARFHPGLSASSAVIQPLFQAPDVAIRQQVLPVSHVYRTESSAQQSLAIVFTTPPNCKRRFALLQAKSGVRIPQPMCLTAVDFLACSRPGCHWLCQCCPSQRRDEFGDIGNVQAKKQKHWQSQ